MDLNVDDVMKRYAERVANLTHEIILLETQVVQLTTENETLKLSIESPPPSDMAELQKLRTEGGVIPKEN